MSLKVEYGPIALAGALAAQAGSNESAYKNQQMVLEQQRLSMEQQAETSRQMAQDRAFSLQQAMASQVAVAQRRTPAADHVAEHLSLENQQKQNEQKLQTDYLDKMLASGKITQQQHDNAMIGVLTGNHELMSRVLAPTEKTDPMEKASFQGSMQQIRDRIKALYEQKKEIQKNVGDPFKTQPPAKGPGSLADMDDQIKTATDEAHKLITDAMKETPAGPAVPTGNIAGYNPNGPVPSSSSAWIGPAAGQPAAAPISAATAPVWQGHPDGSTFTSPSTGKRFIIQNGQPVPYTPPATVQPAPAPVQPSSSYPEGYRIQGEKTDQVMRGGKWVDEPKPEDQQTPVFNPPSGNLWTQQ